jgi:hypothetical protein
MTTKGKATRMYTCADCGLMANDHPFIREDDNGETV